VADAVVKFDAYRNLQRHRAVLPAIARLVSSSREVEMKRWVGQYCLWASFANACQWVWLAARSVNNRSKYWCCTNVKHIRRRITQHQQAPVRTAHS